jgi:hypothetical protein
VDEQTSKYIVGAISLVVVGVIMYLIFFSSSSSDKETPTPATTAASTPPTPPTPPTTTSSMPSTTPQSITSEQVQSQIQSALDDFEKRKKQTQGAIVTTCGQCTDNIYNVDCLKDDITYTCVAGKWVNFGKQSLIIAKDKPMQPNELASGRSYVENTIVEGVPPFSSDKTITAFIICPDAECKQVPRSRGWFGIDDVFSTFDRIDPTFKTNVVNSVVTDVEKYAREGSLNGLIGTAAVRKQNNRAVLDDPQLGRGFWFTGPTPSKEWMSFIRSKGIGVSL